MTVRQYGKMGDLDERKHGLKATEGQESGSRVLLGIHPLRMVRDDTLWAPGSSPTP